MGLRAVMLLWITSLIYLSHGDLAVDEELIVPKHSHPSGGSFHMNPEGSEVLEAARKAVEEFNKRSSSKKYFRLLNVTSAEAQVTNLINYKIDAVIVKTKCLKSEEADIETCILGKKQKQRTCRFEVTFNPQNDTYELLLFSCKR
ncbi:hypothetical protein COCON_G00166620 [Conger conger]|uniref:Cystatin domain-containing protein n=1 Tax=Conger conger TaxID=82655 RepID=A0A9Q1D7U9_CONCO|nr:cystatin [Conger conger]KAJ8260939.1 hypothetical protein COCON_G00166620 [Conger conger]